MSSLIGLLSFVCLLLPWIFQRKLIMTSIMCMEDLPNFYKVKVEVAPMPTVVRPLMFMLPMLEPETMQ